MSYWIVKKCPVCGKEFFPTSQWAYKKLVATHPRAYKYWCSYSCKKKHDDAEGEKQFTCKRKVECYTPDGKYIGTYRGINNAAEDVGGGTPFIKKAIENNTVYLGRLWKYKEVTE
jgi:hypothetical protein